MIKVKIFAVISWLLLVATVSGCGGVSSPALIRTVVSETLVAQIDSLSLGSPLIFSPDARRVAYVADRYGKKSLVVDGLSGKGYDSVKINFHTFSPNSKHIAYVAIVYGEKPPVGNRQFVVIDGEEGESYNSATDITFSPDSKHIAYMADGSVFLDRVSVKGPVGTAKSAPLFSPDSQHLAYVVDHSSGGQSVVYDGVPGRPYGRIGAIAFSPDSKHLAYRAITGRVSWVMVVDRKEVGHYESGEWHLQDIVFSPDSAHLAYRAGAKYGSPEHRQSVVLDGKELSRHKGITGKLVFSPDSNHLVYNADGFIFVDDVEEGVWKGSFIDSVFSPDSTRLAYVDIETGFWSDSYTAAWIVIDGVKGKKYRRVGDITFSPDSKHVAYIATQGKKQFVVVDEEKGKEYDIFGHDFGVSVSTLGLKRIIWDSADSFHYLAQKDNGIYLVEETITEQ